MLFLSLQELSLIFKASNLEEGKHKKMYLFGTLMMKR